MTFIFNKRHSFSFIFNKTQSPLTDTRTNRNAMNADASTQVLCMKQLSNYHSIIVGMHQHCKQAPAESDFTLKWQRGKIQVTLKQKCIAGNRLSELDSQKLGLKCKKGHDLWSTVQIQWPFCISVTKLMKEDIEH